MATGVISAGEPRGRDDMPFRILSLSGGGIRGIFQAVYLREIARHIKGDLFEHFELISGTSTGAIIALGVAFGINPNDIDRLFKEHGKTIFPPSRRRSAMRLFSWLYKGPRYQQEPLRRVLENVFGTTRTLRNCHRPVVIPATTLDSFRIRTFSTIDSSGLAESRDKELLAVDVALASAAAPLFFPSVQTHELNGLKDERTYVDGGVWGNTPSLQAIMEAHRHLHVPFEDMRLISIGNGEIPQGQVRIEFDRMVRAKMIGPIIDMMFSTQSQLANAVAAILLNDDKEELHINGERNVLLVNATLKKNVDLDDVDAALDELSGAAVEEARVHGHRFIKLLQG
jgi:patatin-like phospholipase/acyl hydrolase